MKVVFRVATPYALTMHTLVNTDFSLNVWRAEWTIVIKLFSCSAQVRLKFILLMNVKMPTIFGILTFIRGIYYMLLKSKPSISRYLGYFSIYEQLKFQAQLTELSMKKVL